MQIIRSISLDIFATAAEIADAQLDKRNKIDGVNLMPYLTGDNNGQPHDELFWRISTKSARRKGNWKLLRNPGRGQGDEWELYNLRKDISETDNLATNEPEKLNQLLNAWESINAEMMDPVWVR